MIQNNAQISNNVFKTKLTPGCPDLLAFPPGGHISEVLHSVETLDVNAKYTLKYGILYVLRFTLKSHEERAKRFDVRFPRSHVSRNVNFCQF